ncbi:MAG: hypothetical protein LBC67_02270 [Spirochaetales bacterium]|jgi:hypothetical protein|nr:hypothetical protein [Spirochaetales bacterium]
MNKRANTFFFIVAASAINLVFMAFLFLFAFAVYHLAVGRFFPKGVNVLAVCVMFAVSVAVTYFVHKKVVAFIARKIDTGRFLSPALRLPEEKAGGEAEAKNPFAPGS